MREAAADIQASIDGHNAIVPLRHDAVCPLLDRCKACSNQRLTTWWHRTSRWRKSTHPEPSRRESTCAHSAAAAAADSFSSLPHLRQGMDASLARPQGLQRMPALWAGLRPFQLRLGVSVLRSAGCSAWRLRGSALFARVGVNTDVHAACMGFALVWSDRHAAASRSAHCTPLAMLRTAVSTCKAWYSISRLSILN